MASSARWKPSPRIVLLCLVATISVAAAVFPYEGSSGSLRRYMAAQIERAGHSDDVWLFMKDLPHEPSPDSYDEVPLAALLPAFMLSTLRTALLIGFQILLPLVVLFTATRLLMKMLGYTRRRIAHIPGCL